MTHPLHIRDLWTNTPHGTMYALVGTPREEVEPHTPLVLVHGLGMSHRYMRPALEILAARFTTYAVDLPGFGKSDKPPHALDVAELSAALHAWLEANGIARAILIANSFGCQICAHLALAEPSRIVRLVLIAPTIDEAARTARQQLFRLTLDAPRESPSLFLLAVREYFFVVGFSRAYRTLGIALADRIEECLPHITASTLVVRGVHDPLVPQTWARKVAALLPHGRLVVIEGAAHAVNYSAPESLARVVTSFIEEV